MTDDFFRFLRFLRIPWLGERTPSDDKLHSAVVTADSLTNERVVEERLGGAHPGIALGDGRVAFPPVRRA